MKRILEATGTYILASLQGAGYSAFLLLGALRRCRHAPSRWQDILRLMFLYGVKSIPVTSIVAVFTGMILSLQTGIELARIVGVQACRVPNRLEPGRRLTGALGGFEIDAYVEDQGDLGLQRPLAHRFRILAVVAQVTVGVEDHADRECPTGTA